MYLTIQETADYLDLPISEIHRLIREKQIRVLRLEDEIMIYREQFNLFLTEREKEKATLEDYLNTPVPEDIDIKDED
ncbi:hypothetical protein BW721_10315 [Jeotgalibaca sp. PTS2502]|uniref:helix-turn-helix domain-containing protein n=1 Tax=Jeotgalibaca sp. PTS2502 TaxID=1903686 RepID=UPI00097350E8|nr:helix-turn-helix domain-containing protein [Jeotgalibaca sp. PTS2502]APZ49984.1 hypothetical protein BW721_10315 [Jeotgalibaca sp. PTS2502]